MSKQQSLEKEIVNANSMEAVKAIELDYSVADIRNLTTESETSELEE